MGSSAYVAAALFQRPPLGRSFAPTKVLLIFSTLKLPFCDDITSPRRPQAPIWFRRPRMQMQSPCELFSGVAELSGCFAPAVALHLNDAWIVHGSIPPSVSPPASISSLLIQHWLTALLLSPSSVLFTPPLTEACTPTGRAPVRNFDRHTRRNPFLSCTTTFKCVNVIHGTHTNSCARVLISHRFETDAVH